MTLSPWLQAARLRTLPLALAATLCGCLLAVLHHHADFKISLLTVATTLALQIFSNFANDYGDAQNGADSALRQGPARMSASGKISRRAMQTALAISAIICCLLGIALLSTALPRLPDNGGASWLLWLLLGGMSLLAAYRYTAGRKPYGYIGLGDVSVFLFFGWLAVLGSEYLHTGRLNALSFLPASGMGLWCVMVLNLNNMRDISSDLAAGKYTVAARLGLRRAKIYHTALALAAALCWLAWLPHEFHGGLQTALPFFILAATRIHLVFLKNTPSSSKLDRLLPQWSLSVLLWVALLWLAV
ncbi:1,4-dihydroxy-2-naphthoate octaprenyltransferase [Neisseria perflava]|uniref:1,4-dihydroxy-2-naphthoate octaprenyltransferase n=1 Tax=Neisseria perflava TaxID=33053 RepID=UPI0020A0BE9E|nr:1,4-dihydroxy-2-naphthoate octaprenyltransferase [Neisseria perflava]MCP1661042.1 1,4-dihydroxy-2-naphthoate octaprenyltransferase [Neisseria perflava]